MTPPLLDYQATPVVQAVIGRLGRTEDIRFSPSRRRLAFSAFTDGRIIVLEIAITPSPSGPLIFLSDYVAFSSKNIDHPHGMAFIDEHTLVVANRTQFVSIFTIPPMGGAEKEFVIKPLRIIWRNRFRRLDSPGSVDVYPIGKGIYRLLICDNYAHVVTSALLNKKHNFRVSGHNVLLAKSLEIPDGVCVSQDQKWIAVSNHMPGTVFIYANEPDLNPESDPVATLLGMDCPHGIRFVEQDQKIIVADAATHFVHVYANAGKGWSGDYQPYRVIRVLDDHTFQLGRYNVEEGGTKGIDVDLDSGVLAMTCEHQPLTFYALQTFLDQGAYILNEAMRSSGSLPMTGTMASSAG
jgi:hypothetical protein